MVRNRSLRLRLINGAIGSFMTLAGLAGAQPTSAVEDQEPQVVGTVEKLLDRLGRQRHYAMAPLFTDNAIIITARERSMGYETRVERVSSWLSRMSASSNPQPFVEKISNTEVTIDSGHLATLRADFEILRDGQRVSSGIDIFTLVRKGNEWKVASIAFTSIPEPEN